MDAYQYEAREGPCLDAAAAQASVRSDDLETETRWPAFAPRAVEFGVHSMLSISLFVEAGRIGALNLYAKSPRAFASDAEQVGGPLAAHAAVAVASERTREYLRAAIDARDVIGQAKGILMEHPGPRC